LRESVSAIFIHEDEFFIVQRQPYLKAFPGYWSFPGGKVDDEDHEGQPAIIVKDVKPYLVSALIREIQEEMNIDLEALCLDKSIDRIELLGVAVTPDFNPRRFYNYYFKIYLNTLPELKADEGEAQSFGMMNAQAALAKYERSEMLVVPPMITILEHLANKLISSEIIDPNLKYNGDVEVPMIESVKGVKQLLPLSNTFPPARRTNCFLIGDTKKVIVDPSPKDEGELKKLLEVIKTHTLDYIFITHHHPDHHEYLPEIATRLNLEVKFSQKTYDLICEKWGKNYLEDVNFSFVKEGDTLTKSNNHDVKILHTPGHDAGQLSLLRDDGAWMIVSDLIQTVGTVVIGGAESDMNDYLRSLERVMEINPAVVYPSHGIAMGGLSQIKHTYKHRLQREQQVNALLEKHKTPQEILTEIYPELEERLKKYALKTIEAHIKKISLYGIG
jgi:ribonuclease/clavin/mitogillin